jgi:predicted  nucleic acid-binding Zn-ribbon protein
MVWVLVGLILGSIVYAVMVIGQHRSFLDEIQPRIARLEKHADQLEKAADTEAGLRDAIKERIAAETIAVTEMKQQVTAARLDLQKSQELEEQLEMQMYKAEFKRSKDRS